MKVTQLINAKGSAVANQFVITTDKGQYLQSYDSIVAFRPHDKLSSSVLGGCWDYSQTTLKYVKHFLGWSNYNKSDICKLIQCGLVTVYYDMEVL